MTREVPVATQIFYSKPAAHRRPPLMRRRIACILFGVLLRRSFIYIIWHRHVLSTVVVLFQFFCSSCHVDAARPHICVVSSHLQCTCTTRLPLTGYKACMAVGFPDKRRCVLFILKVGCFQCFGKSSRFIYHMALYFGVTPA